MAHHRHALLDDGSLKTFVAYLAGSAGQSTGDMAFDDRTTMATGTGQLDLGRRAFAVQARLIEEVENLLSTGRGIERLEGLGNAHGQQASCMEGLP